MTLAIVALAAFASSALADEIDFTNWSQSGSDTVIPLLSVDDDTANYFCFTLSIDASDPDNDYTSASLTGLYIDFDYADADNPYTVASLSGDTTGSTPAPTDFAINDSAINGVTNLNLGDFDVILGWDPKADLDVADLSLTNDEVIVKLFRRDGLGLDDIAKVGVRWQSVGPDGEGSDKETSMTIVRNPDDVNPTPEPGSLMLLGLGLAGLAGARKRRNSSN